MRSVRGDIAGSERDLDEPFGLMFNTIGMMRSPCGEVLGSARKVQRMQQKATFREQIRVVTKSNPRGLFENPNPNP